MELESPRKFSTFPIDLVWLPMSILGLPVNGLVWLSNGSVWFGYQTDSYLVHVLQTLAVVAEGHTGEAENVSALH